jgi:hypothetical protein
MRGGASQWVEQALLRHSYDILCAQPGGAAYVPTTECLRRLQEDAAHYLRGHRYASRWARGLNGILSDIAR